MSVLQLGIDAVEWGLVPDRVTRLAIRRLCSTRARASKDGLTAEGTAFIDSMRTGPIAPLPHLANEQHYEVPAQFFEHVLGASRKYSCCFWQNDSATLEEAEDASLAITCERAEIVDGQHILELGCGWGSLSLWIAEHYPHCQLTAVSNSASQRSFIETQARERKLGNLRVLTADMNDFSPIAHGIAEGKFDRVVSVEMFEHMRNYAILLERIASWLNEDGKLFVHIFCHRDVIYPFDSEGAVNWMGRYFFSGGIMPCANLFQNFEDALKVGKQWAWNGRHYQRTSDAWLARLDQNRQLVMPILEATYGRKNARRWFHRWRMFFLAVSELFGFGDGDEWFVSHYLLERTV